jgi:hypothetical protein
MQVDTKKKWEQDMKEEMDSLVNNRLENWFNCLQEKEHCTVNGFTS